MGSSRTEAMGGSISLILVLAIFAACAWLLAGSLGL